MRFKPLALAAILAPVFSGAAASQNSAPAPGTPGITRTELQRHDLTVSGREVVQVRVDFAPGAVAPRHTHPGEEIVYVLKGTLEYRLEGEPRATLNAGDVLFIPNGKIHSAANVGLEESSELATYVVEKGKPLTVPVR